jgi:hypothetical protein
MNLAGGGTRHACALPGLSVAGHVPHALHASDAVWLEKNCYVDLWIELLSTLRLDPHALWPCTVALDFEGDQWTFFKPPHGELRALYGVDVQELTVWRPLVEHAIEHLSAGRPLSIESDAYWLPDTAGTDYRTTHSKTTIVLNEIDLDEGRVAYFHNTGYHEAHGDDFTALLAPLVEGQLPLFAEFIRPQRRVQRPIEELRTLAWRHLAEHLSFRPMDNPVRRFAARLMDDLPLLREYGLAYYHGWAFGTVRQLGAAADFAARGLAWQQAGADSPLHEAEMAFDRIARDAKTLILKLARAVASPRPADLAPLLDGMAGAWDQGIAVLDRAVAAGR